MFLDHREVFQYTPHVEFRELFPLQEIVGQVYHGVIFRPANLTLAYQPSFDGGAFQFALAHVALQLAHRVESSLLAVSDLVSQITFHIVA